MSKLEDTAYNYGAKIKGKAMGDINIFEAAYDAAEAECKALRVEIDRLREALAELKGQWERMLDNYASADARAERAEAENDRLREALEKIAEADWLDDPHEARRIAREALAPGGGDRV